MAVLAAIEKFEGGTWYTDYSVAGPVLAASRVSWVLSQAPATGRIAVAGCGWGYLVKALRDAGREAFGFDASSYATLKYNGLDPGNAGRVAVASVLNATQMTNFRRNTVGLSGSTRIPLIVSEDLLPALTDAEVTTALAQMRANATKVVHICTCAAPTAPGGVTAAASDLTHRSADFNWKTHARWKQLVGTEVVQNAEGGAVL